jgi:hypothetical protein
MFPWLMIACVCWVHTDYLAGESRTSKTPQTKHASEIPQHLSEVRTMLQYEKNGCKRQVS